MESLLLFIVTAPGFAFLALGLVWMLGWTPSERIVARLTALVYGAVVAASAWLSIDMIRSGHHTVEKSLGDWFVVGPYHFPLAIFVDRLSLPLVVLTSILIGIVGTFSVRYLHRERGFFRFFLLLHLFAFGSLLVFTAASFDLLLGGWELVGITSVLLIAFFNERPDPVRNAARVFATYRIADLGLLLCLFVLRYLAGTTDDHRLFTGEWPVQTANLAPWGATIAGLLLLIAAAGKSAQVPFSGWLPRAMEGPTPSSAIFYGAISVHAGAYLLLRAEPIFLESPVAAGAVVAVGFLTACLGTLSHRVSTDAKTSLAYAAMTQLAVVFMEIGLGFPRLALAHICGHAVVRTLQFLRAPSMLHDYHRIHAASGGHLPKTGEHYHRLVPEGLRLWLYRLGLERGFYDAAAERFAVQPLLHLSRWFGMLESRVQSNGTPRKPEPARTYEGEVRI